MTLNEQRKNLEGLVWLIGIIFLVIIANAVFSDKVSHDSVASTQPVSEVQTTPLTSSVSPKIIASTADMKACADQALIVFKNKPSGGDEYLNTYESHFNASQGKCLYLGTYIEKSGSTDSNITTWILMDAYDNAIIASLIDDIKIAPPNSVKEYCHIGGKTCTMAEFNSFLDEELETTKFK